MSTLRGTVILHGIELDVMSDCEVGCVDESNSPWFCGEYGFVLRRSKPLEFEPCKGMLGFFKVQRQNT